MTREEALAIVREIESIAATSRRDDGGAQDNIRFLIEQLVDVPWSREAVREKVSSIAAWTDILFSDRNRTYGGDEEVTQLLLHDCERLRAAIRGD